MKMIGDHILINSVEKGDSFSGIYYVQGIYEKKARTGKIYTDLQLSDRSGNQFVRFWGKADDIKKNSWCVVHARTDEYNGMMQIIIDQIESVEEPEDISAFVCVNENLQQDKERFEKYISKVCDLCDEINDVTCINILGQIFTEEFKKLFFEAAYNDQPTYGKKGGVLSHTVKVVNAIGGFAQNYKFSVYETVISVTSALLHGCGAISAFDFKGAICEKSIVGNLHGLKNLTLNMISPIIEKIQNTKEFNKETAMRIYHSLVTFDNNGTILPMTKEAILLAEVINMDLKLTSAVDFIESDTNSEDKFTAFDTITKRHYYK